MKTELELIFDQLPVEPFLCYFEENGNFEIVERLDMVEQIVSLHGQSLHYELKNITHNNWRGFETYRKARLYLLHALRCWRNEIDSSVQELRKLKVKD